MNREEYRRAFDEIPFSADFQERTANLLRQRARELEKENKTMNFSKTKKMAVMLAAAVALLAVSVSAAMLWLTPSQVAQRYDQPLLAAAFESEAAVEINKTVETGDFSVTLLGMVSGENLDVQNQDLDVTHTYAVLALRRLDGTPLDNETFDFCRYTMTPLVAGCSPAAVNNWTLDAGASGFAEDGVYYYLLDTQSLEIFADRTVYMAFYEGGVPNNTIFTVRDDGTIAFCDDFAGVQALFELPLDPAGADRAAVKAFLAENNMGWTNDRTPPEEFDVEERETEDGMTVTIRPAGEEVPAESPYTVTPEEIAAGTPYTQEEAEQIWIERRERVEEHYANGTMSPEDYALWTQGYEGQLEGIRSGAIAMVRLENGMDYSYFVSGSGAE